MKKLFLIDAYALIFRYYYAFIRTPMRAPDGNNVSAVFGFIKFINDIIKKEAPDMLGVAFDPKGGNFRNKLYPLYKANRDATPEDIIKSTPLIKEYLQAMNIPILEVQNYEADDVIGTLSDKAAAKGYMKVYMVTPDKDYAQLVRDNVFMYKPAKRDGEVEIVDAAAVCANFGIKKPKQVIDILAIWGDASDNIPGVTGIGEKGASKLVGEWGEIENILKNIDLLPANKQKEYIIRDKEQLLLSKQLATIDLNVPIELNELELMMSEPNQEALNQLYMKLGFKSFMTHMVTVIEPAVITLKPVVNMQPSLFDFGDTGAVVIPAKASVTTKKVGAKTVTKSIETGVLDETQYPTNYETIHTVNHKYYTVDSNDMIEQLIEEILSVSHFAFDTETTSVEPMRAKTVGLSISTTEHTAYWVPFDKIYFDRLKPMFENPAIAKIGHNIKYDIMILKNEGINVVGRLWDTMIMHYIINPEARHSMDRLSADLLGYEPVHIEELIGKGVHQTTMDMIDPVRVAQYGAEDADVTLRLFNFLLPEVEKNGLSKLYINVEEPLIDVLVAMERNGVAIDVAQLQSSRKQLVSTALEVEKYITELAGGMPINPSSPKQLGEFLFDKLKINPNAKRTKTGAYKTDEETLQSLSYKHPVIEKILEYRSIKKLLSSYIDALPALINPKTGLIHTSYNQAVTATGRLSSTAPNLQNIPIRDNNGKEIRRSFIPSIKGWKIVAADYSQIELRIMAHLANDQNMIAAFNSGEDIHTSTAAKINGKQPCEVTESERRQAKTANFGIIYGISAFGLSNRLGISSKEAKELIDSYFRHFPEVKIYMEAIVQKAREDGYVETIFGRRRFLKDIVSSNGTVRSFAERNAVNAPIQGSAADIMKIAMRNVYNALKLEGFDAKLLLQVHDEIVLEAPVTEIAKLTEMLKKEMMRAANLVVPLITEVGVGENWLEAH